MQPWFDDVRNPKEGAVLADIRQTLEAVRKRLNQFIRAADPGELEWVLLSNLVDPSGTPYQEANNRLVMFLANVARENTIGTYNPTRPAEGNRHAAVAPPLYVDLYVLVVANFYNENYKVGLDLLTLTLSFFQQNPFFTPDNLPDLPAGVDRLTFELANLPPTELSYVLGLAGVKYLPSAYYKVRMLPFQSDAVQKEVPAVQGVQTPGQPEDFAPSAQGGGGLGEEER